MNYVICEIYKKKGFKRSVKFLSGMFPEYKTKQWSLNLQNAFIFDEEDSKQILEILNKSVTKETWYKLKKINKKINRELGFFDLVTGEQVIGPKGMRLRARAGCNEETGELF